MMLKFDKDEARRLILGSAYQYKGDMASPTITIKHKSLRTSTARRRNASSTFCARHTAAHSLYLFADVVEKGFLPQDRAVGCKREYIQLSHAFDTLMGPHIDTKLARKLHKHWLPPVTTKPRPWEGRGTNPSSGHASYSLLGISRLTRPAARTGAHVPLPSTHGNFAVRCRQMPVYDTQLIENARKPVIS